MRQFMSKHPFITFGAGVAMGAASMLGLESTGPDDFASREVSTVQMRDLRAHSGRVGGAMLNAMFKDFKTCTADPTACDPTYTFTDDIGSLQVKQRNEPATIVCHQDTYRGPAEAPVKGTVLQVLITSHVSEQDSSGSLTFKLPKTVQEDLCHNPVAAQKFLADPATTIDSIFWKNDFDEIDIDVDEAEKRVQSSVMLPRDLQTQDSLQRANEALLQIDSRIQH